MGCRAPWKAWPQMARRHRLYIDRRERKDACGHRGVCRRNRPFPKTVSLLCEEWKVRTQLRVSVGAGGSEIRGGWEGVKATAGPRAHLGRGSGWHDSSPDGPGEAGDWGFTVSWLLTPPTAVNIKNINMKMSVAQYSQHLAQEQESEVWGKDGEDSISKQCKMGNAVTAIDFCFQKIAFCNLSLFIPQLKWDN